MNNLSYEIQVFGQEHTALAADAVAVMAVSFLNPKQYPTKEKEKKKMLGKKQKRTFV